MDYIIFIFLIAISGCGAKLDRDISSPNQIISGDNSLLEGSFKNSTGSDVLLSNNQGLPTVIVFSEQFCGGCINEAKDFKAALANPLIAPSKINLYTVLVGDGIDVANQWKSDFGLPWIVGADENLKLFKTYCATPLTPCTIIHDPQKGIVFKQAGPVSVEKIKSFTGDWN